MADVTAYIDSHGRRRRLTIVQRDYLAKASRQAFTCGDGGFSSTQTVRLLEERGLLRLSRQGYVGRWRVTGLTELGRQVLGDE